MIRRGVIETFAQEPDLGIIAEGATADDAIRICNDLRPDLLVLDVNLPGGGLDALARIVVGCPETVVVMMSIREDLSTVRAALRAGAQGYVSKGVGGDELVSTLRRVLAGERFISPELAVRLILEPELPDPIGPASKFAPALTTRESQIVELIAQDMSTAEIASSLGLSENTIKHYLTPLFHKLGARNRTEAAATAKRMCREAKHEQ
jgi:DNA-binding NarL/FixJ family response regulator